MRITKWVLGIINAVWLVIFFAITAITQHEVSQKFASGQCPANHPVGDFGCSNGLTVAGLMGITMILWFATLIVLLILRFIKTRTTQD